MLTLVCNFDLNVISIEIKLFNTQIKRKTKNFIRQINDDDILYSTIFCNSWKTGKEEIARSVFLKLNEVINKLSLRNGLTSSFALLILS